MSLNKLSNYAFYALLVMFVLYRGLSVLRSDMFSFDVFKNSFMAMINPSNHNFELMKVSSPVRPLHPPKESYIPRTDREDL